MMEGHQHPLESHCTLVAGRGGRLGINAQAIAPTSAFSHLPRSRLMMHQVWCALQNCYLYRSLREREGSHALLFPPPATLLAEKRPAVKYQPRVPLAH